MKYRLIVLLLVGMTAWAQQQYPPPSSCPVLASLASSKLHNDDGDNIVIWTFNQGHKTVHGIEYRLFMLDVAGNRYPASQTYHAKGDVEPNSGDVVIYPAKNEQEHFGEGWSQIEGVEVHVSRVLFTDATVWTPRKGVVCKTAFLNSEYDKEMARRDKIALRKYKVWAHKWNREHPNNKVAIPNEDKK